MVMVFLICAGLVYWVADGINGAPYTETYASRHCTLIEYQVPVI